MENNKWNWNDFDNLQTAEDLRAYWNREYEHTDYSHYTNLDALDSIISTKSFWLSPVSGFNDKKDMCFINDKNLYYSLCFSTGTSENLALWYMYSGMNGKGGRITFTKFGIRKIINNSVYVLQDAKTNKNIYNLEKDDMDISFKDVIYRSYNKGNNNIYLRYNTMTNRHIEKNDFESFEKDYKCFVKSGIWYHEKETRLLVKLKGNAAEIVKNSNKNYRIVMCFDSIPKLNFNIMLAPEITDLREIDDKKHLSNYRDNYSKVKLSEYSGEIEMKLCEKCQKGRN